MGRITVFLSVWLIGYVLGFAGYLAYPTLSEMAINSLPFFTSLDSRVIGATIAGTITSFLTLIGMIAWARSSRTAATPFTT